MKDEYSYSDISDSLNILEEDVINFIIENRL